MFKVKHWVASLSYRLEIFLVSSVSYFEMAVLGVFRVYLLFFQKKKENIYYLRFLNMRFVAENGYCVDYTETGFYRLQV